MNRFTNATAVGTLLLFAIPAVPVSAQEAIVGVADPDALFVSKNPVLNRNKQAAYHIVKELLEANHWELTDKWIAESYVQHNPQVQNGRQAVIDYFVKTLAMKPTPIPVKMKTQIISVLADGDKVIVAYAWPIPDKAHPGKTYNVALYDLWRFRDGKAVEHWDTHTTDDEPIK